MSKTIGKLGGLFLAGALCASLMACGGSFTEMQEVEEAPVETVQEIEQEPEETTVPEDAWAPVVVLGTGTTRLRLKNELGSDVVAVYLKSSESQEWPKELTHEGLSLEKGAAFEVDFTPISDDTTYDLWLTTADGAGYDAKQLVVTGFGDAEVSVKSEDGVTFVEYVDAAGAIVSTKDAALAIKEAEDAAAEEARLQAEAEAEAQAAAEDEYYYEEDYSYDDYYYEDYSYDDYSASQSSEGCLSDMF